LFSADPLSGPKINAFYFAIGAVFDWLFIWPAQAQVVDKDILFSMAGPLSNV